MQQIFILLCSLFVSISIVIPLTAISPKDAKNDLRILDLLPNILCPLAVNPGVPADFVALSPGGNLDPYDWIYWGPKNILQAYFKNPETLKLPVLRVKLSANVCQTGPNSFSDDIRKMSIGSPQEFDAREIKWGDYPLIAVRAKIEDKLVFIAWVGMNDPEGRWVLMFNLVYPDENDRPNEGDLQLWENLLTTSTQLKEEN